METDTSALDDSVKQDEKKESAAEAKKKKTKTKTLSESKCLRITYKVISRNGT